MSFFELVEKLRTHRIRPHLIPRNESLELCLSNSVIIRIYSFMTSSYPTTSHDFHSYTLLSMSISFHSSLTSCVWLLPLVGLPLLSSPSSVLLCFRAATLSLTGLSVSVAALLVAPLFCFLIREISSSSESCRCGGVV